MFSLARLCRRAHGVYGALESLSSMALHDENKAASSSEKHDKIRIENAKDLSKFAPNIEKENAEDLSKFAPKIEIENAEDLSKFAPKIEIEKAHDLSKVFS